MLEHDHSIGAEALVEHRVAADFDSAGEQRYRVAIEEDSTTAIEVVPDCRTSS